MQQNIFKSTEKYDMRRKPQKYLGAFLEHGGATNTNATSAILTYLGAPFVHRCELMACHYIPAKQSLR